MIEHIHVGDVRFSAGSERDVRAGLIGFISCTVNNSLRLDGITLRRTSADELALSFPSRRDRSGQDHPLVRPLGDDVRRSVQAQIMQELRAQGGLA